VDGNTGFGRRRLGVVAAAAIVMGAACSRGAAPTAGPLPQVLHGLALVDARTGREATQVIAHLHRGPVVPNENYVAAYGPKEMRATLYLSRYATADSAAGEVTAMAKDLTGGGSGFGHYTHFAVAGADVHSVFGPGEVNYFYAKDRDVVWLAMPPMLARGGLAQLLAVPEDSIPPLTVPPQP
jgi:hypothetical protein